MGIYFAFSSVFFVTFYSKKTFANDNSISNLESKAQVIISSQISAFLNYDIKEAYLLVECPRQLFPFARRIIYDLHADGSLPPLMLDPVNFAELYKNRKQKANN